MSDFATIDEILDGLEKTSGRLADNLNMPPFEVKTLRQEWQMLKREAEGMALKQMPSKEDLTSSWHELKEEATRQNCSVFELSSVMALSAVTQLPAKARWLSQCASTAAGKTGMLFASTLLANYATTLQDIRKAGYLHYWARQLKPYLSAAGKNFSPSQSSYTERFLQWCAARSAQGYLRLLRFMGSSAPVLEPLSNHDSWAELCLCDFKTLSAALAQNRSKTANGRAANFYFRAQTDVLV